ncbi:expressed unknown protein [Seminavis robusta]|uniref:HORMA domain-containing protein n=1 Tax=Seminavis robusta TaxID=568900 RepID=A0A9N8HHR7_9STRA|nr:expressed unknown protein [Seminavis robusta]|eukprot:Sro579_g169930.1 n/a (445) ;mRNA; r:5699-7033
MSSTTKGGTGPPPLASHLLVAAALETWSHHLLYIRRVYPSSSFCDSYFLGIRCKANRHPGVVEYIRDAVQVAVPVLLGQTASEFCLEVVDDLVPQDKEEDKDNPLLLVEKKKKEKHDSQDNDEESEEDTPIDLPLHDDDDDDKSESDSEQQPQLGSIAQKLQELSTPSSSQEESTRSQKRRRKEEEEGSTDVSSSNAALQPAILFQERRQHETNKKNNHQITTQQQSLSSLSQHDHPSQQQMIDTVEDEEQEDDEKATDPGYNIDSLTPDTEETARSRLQYKSLQVLERFSLHFSMPTTTTTQEQQQTIVNVENNRNSKKPRLGRFRPSAKKPTPKQTDPFQAVLPELERAFRNLILHLASLKRDRVLPSHTLSFKLLLLHTEEGHVAVLDRAFSVGSWYPASSETDKCIEERRPRLPLYQVGVGNSLLDIRFHMQRLQPDGGS